MARHASIAADVATTSMPCHECNTLILELGVMFWRSACASEPVDGPFGAAFPICRGCFEREMGRRVAELRA